MPVENGYLPPGDNALAQWATNFSTLITATPTTYGLTSGQATAFGTLKSSYVAALALATNVSTRTKSTVAAKNAARNLLLVSARQLANIVQRAPTTTNAMRQDLQLTVRDTSPSPVPPPSTYPLLTLTGSTSNQIFARFADSATPASRSKPFGAIALQLYAKVGTTPPVGIADCVFKGNFTKNTTGPGSRGIAIDFAPADAGKTAYVIGVWVNRRGEPGPAGPTVTHTIAA